MLRWDKCRHQHGKKLIKLKALQNNESLNLQSTNTTEWLITAALQVSVLVTLNTTDTIEMDCIHIPLFKNTPGLSYSVSDNVEDKMDQSNAD